MPSTLRVPRPLALAAALSLCVAPLRIAPAQSRTLPEARIRWDRRCQMRKEKFDYILPEAMRENGVDMWIVAQKEGHNDPLAELLGGGYTGSIGYFIFTDRGGDRIERAALGIEDHHRELCGAYDIPDGDPDLLKFVTARNPKRIGLNLSAEMGMADGLSHTLYDHIVKTIGPALASRIVSAEKLVSDFSSRRVASEIVAVSDAGEIGRQIAERALSNDRIIQRGDLIMLDFGVGYLNMWTDQKRIAYVLKTGETKLPESFQRAFDNGIKVRDVIHRTAKPGKTAKDMMEVVNAAIVTSGFVALRGFNQPRADASTEFIVGCHSVGDWGHGIGPSMAFFNPGRLTYAMRPTNLFSIELFAYTPIPEWGGKKLRIPLEDDAIVTTRGVEWVYPVNQRIILVK